MVNNFHKTVVYGGERDKWIPEFEASNPNPEFQDSLTLSWKSKNKQTKGGRGCEGEKEGSLSQFLSLTNTFPFFSIIVSTVILKFSPNYTKST